MDQRPPIDLPDDFGIGDGPEDARTVSWAAAALALVLVIAAVATLVVFA